MNQESIKDQLRLLVNLQEIDLQIYNLEKRVSDFPNQTTELRAQIQKLKAQGERKITETGEKEKIFQQANAAIQLNSERFARTSKKLEDVSNTKEFQAATKEVEQLKKLNDSLEEQKTAAQTEYEKLRKESDELQTQLNTLQAELDNKNSAIAAQESKIRGELAELNRSKEQYTEKVEKQFLLRYDRIRVARFGLGIVPAVGGRCKGCNMVLMPQLVNELRRYEEVVNCPSCHRILFFPEEPGQTGAAPSPSR